MAILDQLATSQGRRDEELNQKTALDIVSRHDRSSVSELVALLAHKNKNIQSDAIKVLYEIGERQPGLIELYDHVFLDLLNSKDNRLVWGAMTALDCLAPIRSQFIYQNLPRILDAADKGSVITKDHAISILIKLAANPVYTADVLSLLLNQMHTCPTNQLPMYAENALVVISDDFRAQFVSLFNKRLPEIEKDSKRKRVEKVIRKLTK